MLLNSKKTLVAIATVAMEKLTIPNMKASGLIFLIMSRILMNFLIIGQSVNIKVLHKVILLPNIKSPVKEYTESWYQKLIL